MAPCDFWLFPRLKTPLKGSRFDSREDIIQNATAQLHAIPKEAFRVGYFLDRVYLCILQMQEFQELGCSWRTAGLTYCQNFRFF
jgi:hypothetical protein